MSKDMALFERDFVRIYFVMGKENGQKPIDF